MADVSDMEYERRITALEMELITTRANLTALINAGEEWYEVLRSPIRKAEIPRVQVALVAALTAAKQAKEKQPKGNEEPACYRPKPMNVALDTGDCNGQGHFSCPGCAYFTPNPERVT